MRGTLELYSQCTSIVVGDRKLLIYGGPITGTDLVLVRENDFQNSEKEGGK